MSDVHGTKTKRTGSMRVRLYRTVCSVVLCSLVLTGCVGETRFDRGNAETLLASGANSVMYERLQGDWVATATIGDSPVEQRIRVQESLIAVDVEGESSQFAIFDILSEGDDWAKIVILRADSFSFSTLRMAGENELWIEHYPHTHYEREAVD